MVIPAAYASGGTSQCSEGYVATRSFLDLLVGGCTLASGDALLSPTQPEQADPDAPQGGAGAPYRLTVNATSHAVTGCAIPLFPMLVSVLPMLRLPQTRKRQLILPSHFIAVTLWVECFRLLPMVPRERRIDFFNGLGADPVST